MPLKVPFPIIYYLRQRMPTKYLRNNQKVSSTRAPIHPSTTRKVLLLPFLTFFINYPLKYFCYCLNYSLNSLRLVQLQNIIFTSDMLEGNNNFELEFRLNDDLKFQKSFKIFKNPLKGS